MVLVRVYVCLILAFASLEASASRRLCEDSLLAHLRTVNFQNTLKDKDDLRGEITRALRDLPTDQKIALDQRLTAKHAAREMSFQVKNDRTGNYDKFVAVRVNAQVAPILQSDFDRLVRSTGPLMRAYRALLQKIYSLPNASVQALGLDGIPEREAALAREVIYSSIYFEPALVDPRMKDYPFLTVAGFDGAVVDPNRPTTDFFETNLGTPSGLSNNAQMLDDLLKENPALKTRLREHLPFDNTFSLLRQAVADNALAWTRREGLSVVISPGIYNGAHPDVAALARLSGMPLVKSSDLFEDQDGWIRLRVGSNAKADPVVTGIYGRMEDSYFLQSAHENIPMISPSFQDQSRLEAKLGLKLRPGALYDWVYDDHGQITDVERDENGEPRLMQVWDTLGASHDPKASFAKAIRSRRLYYSGLGGRVVDDKRLFRILTSYLLPAIEDLAHPVKSLSPFELGAFFADPSDFVVKEPNNSGGSGIYFPRAMEPVAAEALIARVRENPSEFEVQRIATIATLAQENQTGSREVPIDLRLFVMMDSKGTVRAGPNSLLIRTGAEGGLYTNTSRGGGYGIGLVVNEGGATALVPRPPKPRAVAISRYAQFGALLELSREVLECASDCHESALQLSFSFREVLDLLDPNMVSVIEALRAYAHAGDPRTEPPRAVLLEALKGIAEHGDPNIASAARQLLESRDAK